MVNDKVLLEALRWEADYWHLMAIEKRRLWYYVPGRRRNWLPTVGGDEYGRLTVVIGTPVTGWVVIALWRERCAELKEELAELRRRVNEE